jgi:hypothetical protein
VTDSLQTLLAGIVDYAGLFPPAKLPMDKAVQAYAEYLNDPQRFMLARFVVPVARLTEFEDSAKDLLPRGDKSPPWHLSALVGPDVADDYYRILKFNARHRDGVELGRAVIDSVEIRVGTPTEIAEAMRILPQGIRAFFEVPTDSDPTPLIRAIQEANQGGNAMAKIRTGGVVADAFPTTQEVARFIRACRDHNVAFKATAGLHHPIRGEYRLTYEPDSPQGTMYGYLNVFGAALLAWTGASEASIAQILEETDINSMVFDSTGFTYRGHTVPLVRVQEGRESFAISFGSCSFREPVDDLAALGFLK